MNIENFCRDAFKNRSRIKPDEMVSCYYCRTSYLGKYITEWTDNNQTAICPCGIDSVVPYEVDPRTLEKAYDYWFGCDGDLSFEQYYSNLNETVSKIQNVKFIKEGSNESIS